MNADHHNDETTYGRSRDTLRELGNAPEPHIVIIGSGSGAFAAAIRAVENGVYGLLEHFRLPVVGMAARIFREIEVEAANLLLAEHEALGGGRGRASCRGDP